MSTEWEEPKVRGVSPYPLKFIRKDHKNCFLSKIFFEKIEEIFIDTTCLQICREGEDPLPTISAPGAL
jgi:hypothetical protein